MCFFFFCRERIGINGTRWLTVSYICFGNSISSVGVSVFIGIITNFMLLAIVDSCQWVFAEILVSFYGARKRSFYGLTSKAYGARSEVERSTQME